MTLAIEMDADGPYPASLGIKVRVTPLYVYKINGTDEAVQHAGMMKAEQIEKWIKAAESAYV